ncbi:unnamed protein product [Cuscuta campestris]|uniref:Protein kinase domain-containing protein n=1 Tax=Cuscuta campestris TaxID=132261 RepID=A0A484LQ63_9ASTE|nr:unnamed protein product [Cuscuta campestris]
MATLEVLLFLLLVSVANAQPAAVPAVSSSSPSSSSYIEPFVSFAPEDNFLIDCGSNSSSTLPGNRTFQPDNSTTEYLSYAGKIVQLSLPSSPHNVSPIHRTARVFAKDATYTFPVTSPGWHWIRLHFHALNTTSYNLGAARFSVETDRLVLLHQFQLPKNNASTVVKEFLVNVTTERYSLTFKPKGNVAFINAIEFISAPEELIKDSATLLFPVSQPYELSGDSFETVYRLNMGGPMLERQNDTLGRKWEPDHGYLEPKEMGKVSSVSAVAISYPTGSGGGGGSPLIAPPLVYSSAEELGDSKVVQPNFNITWKLDVNVHFSYLVRLHFCDIVSKSLNELYFNVYINDNVAISGLDLSALTGKLATAFYKDIVVNSSMVSTPLQIKVSPVDDAQGIRNAILNGLEVFKLNNSVGSLGGEYGVDGRRVGDEADGVSGHQTAATVGIAVMFGAFVGLGAVAVKLRKRPRDLGTKSSFSSWLLPLHNAGDSNPVTNNNKPPAPKISTVTEFGRYFSLAKLQEATSNWESSKIIGIGGFGNVYLGEIDGGIKVAVKRGSPASKQGVHEFHTEIQMLSKLRHRHLVSLIGYCDENKEMILVYEYMANGPLRDHLYGPQRAHPLPWKARLEICIGAARGLHYLHTGASQGIIHRDVKSTNILLDDEFVAKVADFGLSKSTGGGHAEDQTHVSTAVKGSFGYLDPEYFRKQRLTEKSDVYSFGVVLLEALCGRPAIDLQLPMDQTNLAEWALQRKRKGLLEKIVDPNLTGQIINPESMKKFAEAAEKCLAEHCVDRPSMGDVLWNLEYALQLQEPSSSSSSQGKADEENKSFAAPNSPAVLSPANCNGRSEYDNC